MTLDPQKVLHLYKEEEKVRPKIDNKYIISEKLDGWYVAVRYTVDRGWEYPISSAGRYIPSMEHTVDSIWSRLPNLSYNALFIMEAVIPGKEFYETNGLFNRSTGDYACEEVEFHIHDLLNMGYVKRATDRYSDLKTYLSQVKQKKVHLHPYLGISDDKKVWMRHAENVWEKGGEGVVLKQVDGLYYPGKRNSSLMKIKLEETYDLLCIRQYWTVGDKGNDNLNLDLKDDLGFVVSVRIGKHKDIEEFEKDSPVGKIVEIKCMTKTKDGSYREPRFKCVRYDK